MADEADVPSKADNRVVGYFLLISQRANDAWGNRILGRTDSANLCEGQFPLLPFHSLPFHSLHSFPSPSLPLSTMK